MDRALDARRLAAARQSDAGGARGERQPMTEHEAAAYNRAYDAVIDGLTSGADVLLRRRAADGGIRTDADLASYIGGPGVDALQLLAAACAHAQRGEAVATAHLVRQFSEAVARGYATDEWSAWL